MITWVKVVFIFIDKRDNSLSKITKTFLLIYTTTNTL